MIEIKDITEKKPYYICPDFIYNRYDLYSDSFRVLKIVDENKEYDVEVEFKNDVAYPGLWLRELPEQDTKELCNYLFKNYPMVKKIEIYFSLTNPSFCLSDKGNHFTICLPGSIEEKDNNLSKKSRYNLKREKRIIKDELGDYKIKEYTTTNVPKEVFDLYFDWKKETYEIDYKLDAKGYCDRYHVSNIYTMEISDRIVGIMLSCEQLPIVFLDNLTYDTKLSNYSIGKVFYDIYIETLIEKGKHTLFLGGGQYSYKRRYNSKEDTTYDLTIYRNRITNKFAIYKYKILTKGFKVYQRIKNRT